MQQEVSLPGVSAALQSRSLSDEPAKPADTPMRPGLRTAGFEALSRLLSATAGEAATGSESAANVSGRT